MTQHCVSHDESQNVLLGLLPVFNLPKSLFSLMIHCFENVHKQTNPFFARESSELVIWVQWISCVRKWTNCRLGTNIYMNEQLVPNLASSPSPLYLTTVIKSFAGFPIMNILDTTRPFHLTMIVKTKQFNYKFKYFVTFQMK